MFSTKTGKIYDGATQIQIRGISHFGFNAPLLRPQFLWEQGWKEQLALIHSLGFNAIRCPFVPNTLYDAKGEDSSMIAVNSDLVGKTPLQMLDMWMAEADRQGLYILLDFHSVSMQRQYPTWFVANPADFNLIYNKQAYSKENWTRDLAFVAQRYANLSHFFGIDIYNEPNGIVRWYAGDANMQDWRNYWKSAVEDAAEAILSANPNLLIFVQGITANFDGKEKSGISINWGENFQPQAYQPLNIPADKLVLSPHTYGPEVFEKPSFNAPDFPKNLSADWETLFGQFYPAHPVVIGEWGGRYDTPKSIAWMNALVDYLISKGISDSFYWCYTPNSGDTGGILNDQLNVREDKMTLLRRFWSSSPSVIPQPIDPPPVIPPVSQPMSTEFVISSFAPMSGQIGTVVTLTGKGFTGVNKAWVGGVHDVMVKVLSDTQVQVTVPAGAKTMAIGLFKASGEVQFAAQSFSIVDSPVPTPAPTPDPNWTPAELYMVMDKFSGIGIGTVPSKIICTLPEAYAYIKKYRVGKEANTVIVKLSALVSKPSP